MHELVSVESFDLEKTYKYILSIQVSLNGFSFSVKTQEENRILAWKNIPLNISNTSVINHHFSEWIKGEGILHLPFKKTRIFVSGDFFTLIPEAFYDESQKNRITESLFDSNLRFEIAENLIHNLNSKLLFPLPPGLNETIQKEIGDCEIAHPVKMLINNLPELQKEYGMVIFLDVANFHAILYRQSTVIMANIFKMASANDIVYFALNALKQNNISIKQTKLFVTGIGNQASNFQENLNSYFPEIILLDSDIDFKGVDHRIDFIHFCQ